MQLTGQWTLKINGDSYTTKSDSVVIDDLGARKKEAVMDSYQKVHYKLTPPQSSIKATILHAADTDVYALDILEANVEVIPDSGGATLAFADCAITPMGTSGEELTVEIVGQRLP